MMCGHVGRSRNSLPRCAPDNGVDADEQRDRRSFSNSFDLPFRGLELIITGGQRLHHYSEYIAALDKAGKDPADYAGYLDAFKFGMRRMVVRDRTGALGGTPLIGATNVREATRSFRATSRA